MRSFRPQLRFLLAAAALSAAPPALSEDTPWMVLPEPMGGRARGLVEAAGKAASADEAARVVGEMLRLPRGQGVSALEAVLRGKTAPVAAREAVLKALADDANCPVSRQLADAVLLAVPKDAWTRPELWLRSLSRFDSPDVEKALAAWVRDPALPFEQRSAAIRALGSLPSLGRLEILLSLRTGAEEPDWAFRDDVRRALTEMFGLSAPPTAAQMDEWRRLRDPAVFKRKIKEELDRRVQAMQAEHAKLIERLVRQEEELYNRTPTDEQPAVLARMLADALPEVRQKALELVNARIAVNQPVAGPLLEAIRACVGHAVPQVRSRATDLLQTLGDEDGAKAVAKRLAAGEEDNAEVLAAMVRLMRRRPQPEALPVVRRLLDHPSVAAEAAAALAAYDDKGLLGAAPMRAELARALMAALAPVRANFAPAESHLLLLGRVLAPTDADGWALVAAWLADPRAPQAAREAAALALEKSARPLAPLLAAGLAEGAGARMTEIALRAVAARGALRADAEPLVARVPPAGALRDQWADALIGWSSRAETADVEAVGRAAVKAGAPKPLAIRMLGKALAVKDLPPAKRAPLLAFRAELSEDGGDLAGALDDCDNAYPALEGAARQAVLAKRVHLRLVQGKLADAAAVCAKAAAVEAAAPLKGPLAEVLAALEKEAGADADKRAALLPALKDLRQALAARPATAELLPAADALLAKWAPPEPPKPEIPPEPKKTEPEPKAGPETPPQPPPAKPPEEGKQEGKQEGKPKPPEGKNP